MSTAARQFLTAANNSASLTPRQAIRRSIEHYDAAVQRGRSRFIDWEAARQKCSEIKREALNNLD